jgi:hypothetical protein
MAKTKVTITGALFDGQADAAAADFAAELTREIALIGQNWIKVEAHGFDKSGRNTGAAAEGVKLTGAGTSYVISGGIEQGKFSWPWLEGTSQRNVGNSFKGYKTFRRTRLRMRKQVSPYAQLLMHRYIARMNGGI